MSDPVDSVAWHAVEPTRWPSFGARDVPIDDCGEPLVAIDDDLLCLNLYRAAGWPGVVERTWVRASVRDRLFRAEAALPNGYSLAVFDAWRSPTTIRALYDNYYGPRSTLAPGFLANPDDPSIVPPHSTGGAVDLTLTLNDVPLGLGTWFDDFTPAAAADAFEEPGSDQQARHHRRLLHGTLRHAGFVGIAEEWWHFSYGDQSWAAHAGSPIAVYGITEPPS